MPVISHEFGRRQSASGDAPQPIPAASTNAEADPDGAGLSLPKPVLGLLFGFGVIALLFGTHVAAMKGFGRALTQHWEQNAGLPEIDRAYKQSGSSSKQIELVHNDCYAQTDFVGGERLRSTAEVMSSVGIAVGRAVKYVSCVANEQPKRFCSRDHRLHLFAALSDYYKLQAKIRQEASWRNADPFANSRAMVVGPEPEIFSSTPRHADTDPRIVSALKFLISNGYVSRDDLIEAARDWPNDLEMALRATAPKQKGCA